jgi:hypothetical protein
MHVTTLVAYAGNTLEVDILDCVYRMREIDKC